MVTPGVTEARGTRHRRLLISGRRLCQFQAASEVAPAVIFTFFRHNRFELLLFVMSVTAEAGGKKSLLSSEEETLPRHLPPLGPRLPQPVLGFSLLSAPGGASWFASRRRPGPDSGSPVPGSAPPLSPPPPRRSPPLPPRSRPPRPQSPAGSGPARAAALLGPRVGPPDTRAGLPTRAPGSRAHSIHEPPDTRSRARIPRRTWTRALAPRAPPRPAPPPARTPGSGAARRGGSPARRLAGAGASGRPAPTPWAEPVGAQGLSAARLGGGPSQARAPAHAGADTRGHPRAQRALPRRRRSPLGKSRAPRALLGSRGGDGGGRVTRLFRRRRDRSGV